MKELVSLQAFVPEDEEIVQIIKACDLHPKDNWKRWFGTDGSYIKIRKNKNITGGYTADKNISTTDIYYLSSLSSLSEISKSALLITTEDNSYALFMGHDERLRLRRKNNEKEWVSYPPLSLPLKDLRTLIKNKNIESYTQVKCAGPESAQGWVTAWPPTSEFLKEIVWNNQLKTLIRDC